MPLTLEQKKQLIASQGFDPVSHYLDEASGDIFEGADPSPTVPSEPVLNPPSVSITPKSSATTVFAKSAASSFMPAMSALGGGALAAQALPFAHVAPPWSEIVAGIGGAVAGGYAGSKIQDAVLPDSAKQAIYPSEQEIQEHPYMNLAGQIAPNALAFNPIKSIQSLARAGKMGYDVATKPINAYANLTAAEAQALKSFGLNTGVNVGSQAGINVAQQLAGDEPFSYGELGREAALGLLLNEPTKLGTRAFGFKPSFDGVPTRQDYIERNRQDTQTEAPPAIEPPTMDLASNLTSRILGLQPNEGKLTPSGLRKMEKDEYGMPNIKHVKEPQRMEEAELRMEDEGGIVNDNTPDPEPLSPAELVLQQVNQRISKLEQEQNIVRNLGGTPAPLPKASTEVKDVYTSLEANLQPKPLDRKYPGKYSEESRASLDRLEPEVDELLAKRGLKKGQYRVEIKDNAGNTILGPSNQKPIAGRSLYPNRQVDLGKEAGADTAYHEAGHIHLEDLARSMDARDRDLVTRAFKEQGSDITAEEFARLNTEERRLRSEGKVEEANAIREKYIAAEESIIDFVGFEGYKRKAGTEGKAKQYFKDYLSRFGKGKDSAKQQLSARLEYEVPYGSTERIGPEVKTEVKPEVKAEELGKNQEEDSDYDKYLAVQKKINERIQEKDFESEEFKALWQENENIKNRNKGMPPSKPLGWEDKGKFSEDSLITSFEKEAKKGNPFGLMMGSDKTLAGNYIADRLKKTKIPTAELDMLKKAGIEEYLRSKKRITSEELVKWVKDNGPQVKVESYGMEGRVSEAKREYDRMTHEWYDGLDDAQSHNVSFYSAAKEGGASLDAAKYLQEAIKLGVKESDIIKWSELHQKVKAEPTDNSPRATSAYESVSAFDTKEKMPEWTKSKGGRNVQRVDVVIPKKDNKLSFDPNDPNKTIRPNEKDLWSPDNLHENLPNTLGWAMIQYKTGKNGEKMAVVVEAQSRWGQSVRENQKRVRDGREPNNQSNDSAISDHPLLHDYNRLILKAAIEQARKEGAERIVISDAESAMMTEGHDNLPTGPLGARNPGGINQESGMRLNYDSILPKIAEELTGGKGERVELGEHKNAYKRDEVFGSENPDGDIGELRDNLIFKNPDGTPKTSVTGLSYDLGKISRRLESGDNFTMAGKYQEESILDKNPNLLPSKPKLDFITSVTDKIASGKKDRTSTKVSSKLRNYFDEAESKFGEFGQSIALLYKDYSPKDVEAHYKKRWEVDNGINKTQTLTGKAKELDDKFQSLIERPKIVAKELKLEVKRGDDYYTIGGIKKDGYIYNIMDPEVIYKLDNEPSSIAANSARRQWREWLVKKGATKEEAVEMITNWERARRDYGDTGGPEFKALRKPEGFGLPWELMDKNPARAALRYGRRAGNDIAYFKHIQSDNEMLLALGLKDQYGKNPEEIEGIDYIGNEKSVQDAMKFVWGKNRTENPRLAAFARLAGNMVMGHGTAIRNIAALPTQLSVYGVKMKDIFKGLSNISESRKRAYESGAARLNPADFDYLGELGNPDGVIKNLDKLSNFLRKWQGRDMSDKFEAELLYSIGEEWGKTNLALARKGDKKAADFLKRALGENEIPTDASQESITKIAKGFVGLTRGTYGPQGLPNWALSGNIAPFVALNRYGIEKWNNVYKDVFVPMKNGNLMPFLRYSLTGIATGAMIEELNQAMSGRKGSDLDIKETMAAYAQNGEESLIASKLIGLAQLSAYAGIVGDMAKLGMRGIEGKDLSYSNPLSFPLYTLATETIGENISAAVGAIKSGEDPIDVMAQFVKSVPLSTIQMARYINNRSDEGERKEEFADYRKYQESVMGVARKEIALGKPNLYEGMERRKFKRTEDIGEAMEMLPTLIEDAIKNAKGDPYKLKAEFRKIKTNNYNTLPDPKNQPLEFFSYVKYLTDTQGEKKASERISKFYSQKYINKAKASLVP